MKFCFLDILYSTCVQYAVVIDSDDEPDIAMQEQLNVSKGFNRLRWVAVCIISVITIGFSAGFFFPFWCKFQSPTDMYDADYKTERLYAVGLEIEFGIVQLRHDGLLFYWPGVDDYLDEKEKDLEEQIRVHNHLAPGAKVNF